MREEIGYRDAPTLKILNVFYMRWNFDDSKIIYLSIHPLLTLTYKIHTYNFEMIFMYKDKRRSHIALKRMI